MHSTFIARQLKICEMDEWIVVVAWHRREMDGDGFVSALGILFCPSLFLHFLPFKGYLEVYLLMGKLIFPLAGLGAGEFKLHRK